MSPLYSGHHLIVLLAILQSSISQRRIKDGLIVTAEKKYVVYLLRADVPTSDESIKYTDWTCGGAIVSANYIITSAACVENIPHMYAIAGYKKFIEYDQIDVDACTKNTKKKVVFTCVPKGYEFNYNKTELWAGIDIAVVKVESPYNFKDSSYTEHCSYAPAIINFNKESKPQEPGTDTIALGWGHNKFYRQDKQESSKNELELRYAPIMIIEKSECIKYYQGNAKIPDLINKYMICTLGQGNIDDKGEIREPTPKEKLKTEGCITNPDKLMGANGQQCDDEDDYISEILDDEGYGDIVVLDGDDDARRNEHVGDARKHYKTKKVGTRRYNGTSKEVARKNKTNNNGNLRRRRKSNKGIPIKNSTDIKRDSRRRMKDIRKNKTDNNEDTRVNLNNNDGYDYEDGEYNSGYNGGYNGEYNGGDNGQNNYHNTGQNNGQEIIQRNGQDNGQNNDNAKLGYDIGPDNGQTNVRETLDYVGHDTSHHNGPDIHNNRNQDDNRNNSDPNYDQNKAQRKGYDGRKHEDGTQNTGTAYEKDLRDVEKFSPGICQNDHGGPLIGWMGAHEILIGVATMYKLDEKLQCRGPYLFTSTHCNAAFLDCIIASDIDNSTDRSRRACEASERQGLQIIERRLSWFGHPDGPAENEMIQERPQIPLSSFHRG